MRYETRGTSVPTSSRFLSPIGKTALEAKGEPFLRTASQTLAHGAR